MKIKSLVLLVTVLCLVLFISGVVGAQGELLIKYAHVSPELSASHTEGEAFKELLEKKTEAKVELFPNAMLGGERDILEGLLAGSIDATAVPWGMAANFIPEFNAISLPFMFDSYEHYDKVMEGEIGKKFMDSIDKKYAFKILFLRLDSFRYPFNAVRPIHTPDDLKRLKIRLMEVPLHMDTYEALGAEPIPVPFAEVYMALELGLIDGAENSLNATYSMKFYEPTSVKYMSLVPMFPNGSVFLISGKKWDNYPEDVKNAILEIADEVRDAGQEFGRGLEISSYEAMTEYGLQINDVDNLEPFIEAVKPVWDDYLDEQPDWLVDIINEIREAAK